MKKNYTTLIVADALYSVFWNWRIFISFMYFLFFVLSSLIFYILFYDLLKGDKKSVYQTSVVNGIHIPRINIVIDHRLGFLLILYSISPNWLLIESYNIRQFQKMPLSQIAFRFWIIFLCLVLLAFTQIYNINYHLHLLRER